MLLTRLRNESAEYVAARERLRARGWRNVRLLSCGASTFKYDLGSEDERGEQESTVSVFTRDQNGTVRHTYSAHPRMADDIDRRGIDLLTPVWHMLDLTPEGRGDWDAELSYPDSRMTAT
jgi:predicted dithiol-disulfide oxidoreductase (DUF899 family)